MRGDFSYCRPPAVADMKQPPRYCIIFFVLCQLSAAAFFFTTASIGQCAVTFEVTETDGTVHRGNLVQLNTDELALESPRGTSNSTTPTAVPILSIPVSSIEKIRNVRQNPYIPGSKTKTITHQQPNRYAPASGSSEQQLAESLDRNRRHRASSEQQTVPPLPPMVSVIEFAPSLQLSVSAFHVNENTAQFRFLGEGKDHELPLGHITAIRLAVAGLPNILQPPDDWKNLVTKKSFNPTEVQHGDQLVVGSPGNFDVYSGILNGITSDTVSFSLPIDGGGNHETLSIQRKKVFGIVLQRAAAQNTNMATSAVLSLWNGSKIPVNLLEWQDGKIRWTSPVNLCGTVPLPQIAAVEFQKRNVSLLTELPLVAIKTSGDFSVLDNFQRTRSVQAGTVIMDGIVYPQSVSIPAGMELEYRLPPNVTGFRAVLGIADRYRPLSAAEVQITADDSILVTLTLCGDAKAVKVQRDLPKNAQALKIAVSPAKDYDTPAVVTVSGELL
jgi:hypothetical protein